MKFFKRLLMRAVSIHGAVGVFNIAKIAHDTDSLRDILRDHYPCDMYNIEEADLFSKSTPRRTYVTSHEDRSYVPGIKEMKAKDGATAYLCTHADGFG